MAFKFIPEPNGSALTDETLLASATQQSADKQNGANEQMLLAGFVFLAVIAFVAAIFLFKRMRRS